MADWLIERGIGNLQQHTKNLPGRKSEIAESVVAEPAPSV